MAIEAMDINMVIVCSVAGVLFIAIAIFLAYLAKNAFCPGRGNYQAAYKWADILSESEENRKTILNTDTIQKCLILLNNECSSD